MTALCLFHILECPIQVPPQNKVILKDTYSVTGSDAHLCLFDKFHKRNSLSITEALRQIGNIPELGPRIKWLFQ